MLRCLNQLFMYSFRDPPPPHTYTTQKKNNKEQGNCEFFKSMQPINCEI